MTLLDLPPVVPTTEHADPTPSDQSDPAVPFVMVGGVPGAGKSMALAAASPSLPGVHVLDSDDERRWFARVAPRVPYPLVRPLVHLVHQMRILTLILRGPRRSAGLIVHDPSTRWVRLALIGWLARLRGWRTHLVFVDVTRAEALQGQSRRGRLVRSHAFEQHWARWTRLRRILAPDTTRMPRRWGSALAAWTTCRVVSRPEAAASVRLLGSGARLSEERCLMEENARR